MNEINFIIYQTPLGNVNIEAVVKDETLWLTQKAMAELFGVQVPAISKHLKNIFEEGELAENMVVSKMEITTQHGAIEGKTQQKETNFYNLDAIISVGYRVNSAKATHFRIWATKILKEFIQKGFVLDDERLKLGTTAFGKDYFRELLERVRSIRASERRIWQQITDIFAECSLDYDRTSPITQEFYAMVQNKFHYAITGQTAAEIVHSKADHTYIVNEDAVHALTREWCFEPTAEKSRNYSMPEIVTEDSLTELCERFRDIIAEGDMRGAPEINVRYAIRDSMFHVAKFGDYFFFNDIMYVFNKDKMWAPYHDEFVAKAFFGEKHKKRGYVHAVAFCGIQTPFTDDKGDAIFTGDICKCYDTIYRVVCASKYEGYGFQ